jgi:CBS domain-containing protein
MLTQSAVINFLATKPGALGEFGKKTVKDLNLGTKPVLTVSKNLRTIDAFKKMHEARVSGLGVVDNNNKLIGNLSARDLKSIDPQNMYSSMYMSVNNFLQKVRQDSIQEVHPAISCTETTTLEYLIGRLAANRIHRMYVCDANFHPVRIISLRDVIRTLMAHFGVTFAPQQQ